VCFLGIGKLIRRGAPNHHDRERRSERLASSFLAGLARSLLLGSGAFKPRHELHRHRRKARPYRKRSMWASRQPEALPLRNVAQSTSAFAASVLA
jgi:hypothetical protein